jgi:hypothetical protein
MLSKCKIKVKIENGAKTHLQHGIVDFIQNVGLTKSILHAFPKKRLRRNLVDYENDEWHVQNQGYNSQFCTILGSST